MDLQPMALDTATEPVGSSSDFDNYDIKAKAYNQKVSGNQNSLNSNQLIQQAAQHPELVMAL